MAADDDTTTAPPPPSATPSGGLLDDPQLQRIIQSVTPQPVQVDTTPVERSLISRIGEALGGGKGPVPLSPADEEAAGRRSLMNFGIGLMAASHYQPGQTLFSNLAQGFQGARRSMQGSEELSAQTLGAQQSYQQQQAQNKLEALKTALPLLQQQRMMNQPNPLAGNTPTAATAGRPGMVLPWTVIPRDTSAGTVGQQANNPGNLMVGDGGLPAGAVGAIKLPDNRSVAAFPDVAAGVAANADNLSAYATQHGIHTVADATNRWVNGPNAKPGTGPDMTSYNNDVAKALGVGPNDNIDLTNPAVQRAFILAQQPHESGKLWLNPADVDKGLALAAARRAQQAQGGPGGPQAAAPRVGATPPPVAATPPPAAPAARPPIVTDQPAGGATVAGPAGAANVGAPAPPGPQVKPDVNAIIRGMTGAGAQPTTLAPGASTQAPQAPSPTTVATNTPPQLVPPVTTTPNAPPAPQPGSQQPTDTRPDVELTPHEYIQRHFTPPTDAERQTFTVPADPAAMQRAQAVMADATKAKAAAAQNLGLALTDADRTKATEAYTKANNDFQTANASISDLQQKAQIASTAAAAKFEEDQRARLATTYNQLQAQKATNANQTQAEQAAAALKAQELQQQLEIERIKSGQTIHQQIQAQSAQNAQANTIAPMSAQAMKAHQMNLGLAQLQPILQDLPKGGGSVGMLLNDHPDLAPLLNAGGVLNDKQADTVRLVNGLVSNISTEMKPTGLGALREYEWDAFKAQLPSLLSTPDGQQKAVAMLMNMNDRIQTESSWMNNYYNRKVPDEFSDKPGAMRPAHDLDSDNPKETVQQRMDRELGPVVPTYTPPEGAPIRNSDQEKWIQAIPPGKPYMKTWTVTDPKTGQLQRDSQGNLVTHRTLEVKPWQ